MLGDGRIRFWNRRDGGHVALVGRRWVGGVVVLALSVSVVMLGAALGQGPSGSRMQGRFAGAADRIFREGLHAKLPPHLSSLLGVSSEEKECLVMQSVLRNANVVQGFDVSTANQNDIVLFVVDETAKEQALYLTSREGRLRRVVEVKEGVGSAIRITDREKKAFEKEKAFWLNRFAPARGSK